MGRNFLDLCNEVLAIMFYQEAPTFEDLETTEGRLVKTKMNNVLRKICSGEHSIWKFREKEQRFFLQEGNNKYNMPNGYITYIRPDDLSNRGPLIYNNNYRWLPMTSAGTPTQYWIFDNKINLYPIPSETDSGTMYKIEYLTNNFAVDEDGREKEIMTEGTDEPIIPEIYRSVLVFGTAKDFRANASDAKSKFYEEEYNTIYNDMLYSQRLSEDYTSGTRVDEHPMTNARAYLTNFYNPYFGSKRFNK